MSNNLRKYVSQRPPEETGPDWYDSERVGEMDVVAMVGPQADNSEATRGLQISLESEYFQLTEEQVHDLAQLLLRRLDPEDPIESTTHLGEFGAVFRGREFFRSTVQQTLSVATDGGDENCAVDTATDRSRGER